MMSHHRILVGLFSYNNCCLQSWQNGQEQTGGGVAVKMVRRRRVTSLQFFIDIKIKTAV